MCLGDAYFGNSPIRTQFKMNENVLNYKIEYTDNILETLLHIHLLLIRNYSKNITLNIFCMIFTVFSKTNCELIKP